MRQTPPEVLAPKPKAKSTAKAQIKGIAEPVVERVVDTVVDPVIMKARKPSNKQSNLVADAVDEPGFEDLAVKRMNGMRFASELKNNDNTSFYCSSYQSCLTVYIN